MFLAVFGAFFLVTTSLSIKIYTANYCLFSFFSVFFCFFFLTIHTRASVHFSLFLSIVLLRVKTKSKNDIFRRLSIDFLSFCCGNRKCVENISRSVQKEATVCVNNKQDWGLTSRGNIYKKRFKSGFTFPLIQFAE